MPSIDFTVESDIELTTRVQQLSAMFDCPAEQKCRIEFKGELPIEDFDWNVGLIVGPSGCGKSSILNRVFGKPGEFQWGAKSVIDDFPKGISISQIAEICQSVGFNTIPAWMRPFAVLSNGEKFRVEMARRLIECGAMSRWTSSRRSLTARWRRSALMRCRSSSAGRARALWRRLATTTSLSGCSRTGFSNLRRCISLGGHFNDARPWKPKLGVFPTTTGDCSHRFTI